MWAAISNFNSFTILEFNVHVVGHFMILAFAKKDNQLIIYVLFPNLFFVTRETNKEKKKSDPSGTRTQDL